MIAAMKSLPLLIVVLALAAGCTYATLSARGYGVQIADASPPGCQNLGLVIGKGGGGLGNLVPNERLIEYAINDARNKAADLGANYVTLSVPQLGSFGQGTTTTVTITGFAYHCPVQAPPPEGTPSASR
jgi:hypothetical protein